MTQVTNTGDTDLDITVDGAFIQAPAGEVVDVPDDVAARLGEPFELVDEHQQGESTDEARVEVAGDTVHAPPKRQRRAAAAAPVTSKEA